MPSLRKRYEQNELRAKKRQLADEISSRADSVVDYRLHVGTVWRDEYLQARLERLEVLFSDFNRAYNELRLIGMSNELKERADDLLEVIVRAIQGTFDAEEPKRPDGERISAAIGRYLVAASRERSEAMASSET